MIQGKKLQNSIFYLLAGYLFLLPLFFTPLNSELFELNKFSLTLLAVSLLSALWAIRMIVEKRIIFKRSFLDIPLILFFLSQLFSTLISIHPQTSFWGYYSRFHQGLLSTISYSLLYWIIVSNINKSQVKKLIKVSLISGFLVAGYGIAQHFGIDKNYWIQDVQRRVFSTLGQPNWLAAYLDILILLALVPIYENWNFKSSLKENLINPKIALFCIFQLIFVLTLIFTKSRSGSIGLAIGLMISSSLLFLHKRKRLIAFLPTAFLFIPIAISVLISSANLYDFGSPSSLPVIEDTTAPPLLITPSTDIRKIVWKGALNLWKEYPVFGTGVETFAYSYYWQRPQEHNLTSEWDFLYNKAHNEYLNFAANSGTVGLVAYLVLCLTVVIWLILNSKKNPILTAFLGAFVSILVTNFFGFSVVIIGVYLYLLPALAFILVTNPTDEIVKTKLNVWQKVLLLLTVFAGIYLIRSSINFWRADYFFQSAIKQQSKGNYASATNYIDKAIDLRPQEAIYYAHKSEILAGMAYTLFQGNSESNWQEYVDQSINANNNALQLNPFHLNIYKQSAKNNYVLSQIDPKYIELALESLLRGIKIAPTDAKLYYNAGLMYQAIGNLEEAERYLKNSVQLKENFEAGHFWLAQLYIEEGKTDDAKQHLRFILERLNPANESVKELLNSLN